MTGGVKADTRVGAGGGRGAGRRPGWPVAGRGPAGTRDATTGETPGRSRPPAEGGGAPRSGSRRSSRVATVRLWWRALSAVLVVEWPLPAGRKTVREGAIGRPDASLCNTLTAVSEKYLSS